MCFKVAEVKKRVQRGFDVLKSILQRRRWHGLEFRDRLDRLQTDQDIGVAIRIKRIRVKEVRPAEEIKTSTAEFCCRREELGSPDANVAELDLIKFGERRVHCVGVRDPARVAGQPGQRRSRRHRHPGEVSSSVGCAGSLNDLLLNWLPTREGRKFPNWISRLNLGESYPGN
jgi:hypothetical protein